MIVGIVEGFDEGSALGSAEGSIDDDDDEVIEVFGEGSSLGNSLVGALFVSLRLGIEADLDTYDGAINGLNDAIRSLGGLLLRL